MVTVHSPCNTCFFKSVQQASSPELRPSFCGICRLPHTVATTRSLFCVLVLFCVLPVLSQQERTGVARDISQLSTSLQHLSGLRYPVNNLGPGDAYFHQKLEWQAGTHLLLKVWLTDSNTSIWVIKSADPNHRLTARDSLHCNRISHSQTLRVRNGGGKQCHVNAEGELPISFRLFLTIAQGLSCFMSYLLLQSVSSTAGARQVLEWIQTLVTLKQFQWGELEGLSSIGLFI